MQQKPTLTDQATRLLPLLVVAVGAVATWTSIQMREDHLEQSFQEHTRGFGHDAWFGSDGVLHPALRGCVERYTEAAIRARIAELSLELRAEWEQRWRQFYLANQDKGLIAP